MTITIFEGELRLGDSKNATMIWAQEIIVGFSSYPTDKIARNARARGVAAQPEARRQTIEALAKRGYPPERVARQMLRAVERGRVVAPVTPEAWVLWYLKRLSPALVRRIGAFMARRSRRQLGLGDAP